MDLCSNHPQQPSAYDMFALCKQHRVWCSLACEHNSSNTAQRATAPPRGQHNTLYGDDDDFLTRVYQDTTDGPTPPSAPGLWPPAWAQHTNPTGSWSDQPKKRPQHCTGKQCKIPKHLYMAEQGTYRGWSDEHIGASIPLHKNSLGW